MAYDAERNWSSLPSELVITIAEKLSTEDAARMRAACCCWAWSPGLKRPEGPQPPPPPPYRTSFVDDSVPWLLLPNERGEDADYCSFLRLSGNSFPRIHSSSEMSGKRCVGLSLPLDPDLYLEHKIFNPLMPQETSLLSILSVDKVAENLKMLHICGNSDDLMSESPPSG